MVNTYSEAMGAAKGRKQDATPQQDAPQRKSAIMSADDFVKTLE